MKSLLRELDASRVARIFALTLPIGALFVTAVALANRQLSIDEIAASVAVPLMVSYLLVRAIIWLVADVPERTPEEIKQLEAAHTDCQSIAVAIPTAVVVVFVVGIWASITASISLGFYAVLGLSWAFAAALSLLKVVFFIVAVSAISICLVSFCNPWIIKLARFFRVVFHFPVPVPTKVKI